MFNNEETRQRTVLIAANYNQYDVEASLKELTELAETAGALVVGTMVQNLHAIINATYIGKGKLQEVKDFCMQNEVELLIFDDELSGAQIRNIEDATDVRVIDRTMLILDIFAQHAMTTEGKLQVELAQQRYLLPRLYGMGAQLSRQGGTSSGSIGNRGPGETKLESDKRVIRHRVNCLAAELKEMELRRERTRKQRKKNDVTTIAIVGYTNVGKSTLLNLLTDAGVLVKNQLFATLDPTARQLKLKDGQTAVFIDTVGFIQRLPHQLVKAFKSTLEEAAEADVILNLCDISNENVDVQISVTKALLDELGCGNIPIITVYNKIDLVDKPQPEGAIAGSDRSVYISATENVGIDNLLDCIGEVLADTIKTVNLQIPFSHGSLLDRIRTQGKVVAEEYNNEGTQIKAIIDVKLLSTVREFMV